MRFWPRFVCSVSHWLHDQPLRIVGTPLFGGMCGNSHWPFPHRTALSLTECWYFSFCAALPQENFVVCPGMEFIAQSSSVPGSVRQKLELRGMWDPCLIANAFDSADELQAYVEHVSVVLDDACCKWTDALSLRARMRGSALRAGVAVTYRRCRLYLHRLCLSRHRW